MGTVGAILIAIGIAFGIISFWNLAMDILFDRIQYWGMFPKKKKPLTVSEQR